MPAFVELVVVDEFGIRAFRPARRSLVQLFREDAHGNRDGDAFDSEERNLALECLPIEASPGNRGVRQPGKRDVVEDIISCQAFGLPAPWTVGLVSGSTIFSCSMIEPGQPCVTMSGNAFSCFERT